MKYRFDDEFPRALRVRGLTASRVAELAQVAPATVSAAVHGRAVTVTSALRIARAVTSSPVIPELEQWATAGESRGAA